MADEKTKEQLETEWWAQWWAADYSWDGLAKPRLSDLASKWWHGWVVTKLDGKEYAVERETGRIYGQGKLALPALTRGRAATLQDYWRADPQSGKLRTDEEMDQELIRVAGQPIFHRCHLPLAYFDGTRTEKPKWHDIALDELLAPRLLASAETPWISNGLNRDIVGSDNRAQLQGGVWLSVTSRAWNKQTPLSVRYEEAFFSRGASFGDATFSGDTRFNRAIFFGDASFQRVTFRHEVILSHTKFFGKAEFEGAAFSGDAGFNSATFMKYAGFSHTTFSADAIFYSAIFSGNTGFDCATFSGDASFGSSSFFGYAEFDDATFSSKVDFLNAGFVDKAAFDNATFSGNIQFYNTTFSGNASFKNATFSSNASFEKSNFTVAVFIDATFLGETTFEDANFKSGAQFHSVSFSSDSRFYNAVFDADGGFDDATFDASVSFANALFNRTAHFNGAKFNGDTDFRAVIFDGLASFEELTWPETEGHWRSAFDKTLFRSTAVFTGADCKAFAAFDGATFERGISLDAPKESLSDAKYSGELRKARKSENPGEALRALEAGCRVLKQAMAYDSNSLREQQFYRYELIARRKQSATPLSEKFFSMLYALTANYGASIGRPFVSVTALVFLFASVYWLIAAGTLHVGETLAAVPAMLSTATVDSRLRDALSFSFSRVFPFGAFEDVSKNWIENLEKNDTLATLGVRILASIQSAIALALVFVFGLAVRRKFQIN